MAGVRWNANEVDSGVADALSEIFHPHHGRFIGLFFDDHSDAAHLRSVTAISKPDHRLAATACRSSGASSEYFKIDRAIAERGRNIF